MIEGWTTAQVERVLGRPLLAPLGGEERRAYAGTRLLITGAAGSIGSAIADTLAGCAPACLTLVDQSELGLFTIERALTAAWPSLRIEAQLADVRHPAAMRRVMFAARPDVVYHAAAYKHVTMAERAPSATAHVNVLGTLNVLEAAAAVRARVLVISSDKAADPTSVMGATKRLAEILATGGPAGRRAIVVRFGNVLGSSGSVVPIVRDCIRRGVPIPITDPDATRYYMTAEEAIALVLRADSTGRPGDIFWLEVGEPIRLGNLADRIMDVEADAGLPRVPTQIIGLRPGEKQRETLADPTLAFRRAVDGRLWSARDVPRRAPVIAGIVAQLRRAAARADDAAALRVLSSAVAGFVPSQLARRYAGRTGRRAA